MKSSRRFCSSSACYIFVVLVSAAAAVQTKSQVQDLQSVTTDGPDDSVASTTADTIISSAEFASRQGFQPSVDYARFAAEERASSSNNNNSTVRFSSGEEPRPKHVRASRKPYPPILKLYDGHKEKYNTSSTDQVAKREALPKYPRIYYGDLMHSNPSDVHNTLQINQIESELSKPHHHEHEVHHDNHNYGKYEEPKKEDEGDSKYYYPKHLLTKYPSEHEHHHVEDEKHYTSEHPPSDKHNVVHHVNYGHLHGQHGYGYPESHHHYAHSLPYEHSSLKYTDQKGHVLEGAFGKALHLLIPSALLLGGVSALFPNRVHVPTTENKYRQKRSISYQAGSADPEDFGDIPAQYLKREHRSNDDGGIELDLDFKENPFHLPNIRPALSVPPRLTSGRTYNNQRLNPHQRFELSPPNIEPERSHMGRPRPMPRGRPSQKLNNLNRDRDMDNNRNRDMENNRNREMEINRNREMENNRNRDMENNHNRDMENNRNRDMENNRNREIENNHRGMENNNGRDMENNNGGNLENNNNNNNNNNNANREMPEQYDAFLFNNPSSYNFEIPPSTFSPDNEPSPIPPTYPSNPAQTTEEMISEEEEIPQQPPVTKATKRPTKVKKMNKNPTQSSGTPRFVPIPIEEPVLEMIRPETTTEMEMDETITTTTTRKPSPRKQVSSRKMNPIHRERESRRNIQNIGEPVQSLEGIASLNKIADEVSKIGKTKPKNVDLSPDGPVIGLLSSYAQHEKDSPECQKKALCELAMKGSNPVSTKFESFLWNLANLVPDQFSQLYDLEEIFTSIRKRECDKFACERPNMDLQV